MAAMTEPVHAQDRQKNRISTWVKRFTSRKNTSNDNQHNGAKKSVYQTKNQPKKNAASKNSPYLASNVVQHIDHHSYSDVPTGRTGSTSSLKNSRRSFKSSEEGVSPPTIGNKSLAPTVATEHDAAHSVAAGSHGASSGGGTNTTIGGGMSSTRGADSTFSSPAPSVRSLTTTLTTIHSAGVGPIVTGNSHNHTLNSGSHGINLQTIQFSHQFPASPIPSALPAHLQPQGSGGHPATYNTATANNLLTDNASILTLASSSKRRRRRSMDTDASVRALAPSSLFGGSRESLPLSVLSSNIDPFSVATHQTRASAGGVNERASIYSATGIVPALPSERNSYYAGKQGLSGETSSMKSGLAGHNRNDSISAPGGGSGSGGAASSPLASPRDNSGRLSRANSAWGDSLESSAELDKVEGGQVKSEASKDKAIVEADEAANSDEIAKV